MSTGKLAVVDGWLGAVNQADGARLEQMTHEQVELVGPRGSGLMEWQVLSEWLIRAGFSAESLRWFCGADGHVVVEQDAKWVDNVTGAEQGRARIASRFFVEENRVASYERHDDGLLPALAAAGLDESDEVAARLDVQ
ncbi:hypothetical protein [Arthrobacter pigmenti]